MGDCLFLGVQLRTATPPRKQMFDFFKGTSRHQKAEPLPLSSSKAEIPYSEQSAWVLILDLCRDF